jgi:signal peptidase I
LFGTVITLDENGEKTVKFGKQTILISKGPGCLLKNILLAEDDMLLFFSYISLFLSIVKCVGKDKREEEKYHMKKLLKEWGKTIVLAVAITFVFRTYVAEAVVVPSGSMLPTIQLQDRLLVEKFTSPSALKYEDVVVFYPPVPGQEHNRYIKRLIGIGGDTIQIKDHSLYRNGVKIDEPYLSQSMNYNFGPVKVPAGKFFFLGDNRNNSYDSHLWPTPFVDNSKIVGKALVTFFPFSDFKKF